MLQENVFNNFQIVKKVICTYSSQFEVKLNLKNMALLLFKQLLYLKKFYFVKRKLLHNEKCKNQLYCNAGIPLNFDEREFFFQIRVNDIKFQLKSN